MTTDEMWGHIVVERIKAGKCMMCGCPADIVFHATVRHLTPEGLEHMGRMFDRPPPGTEERPPDQENEGYKWEGDSVSMLGQSFCIQHLEEDGNRAARRLGRNVDASLTPTGRAKAAWGINPEKDEK